MENDNLLDQFFLIDQKIVEKMVLELAIKKDEVILEIGAGSGFITKRLAEKAGWVIAVEIDKKFKNGLTLISDKTEVVIGDIIKLLNKKEKLPGKAKKIIGNLPSSVIEPLMSVLIKADFELAVFLVPLKFVNKLQQSVYFDSKLICKVTRESFSPIPKTNWALVKVVKKKNFKLKEFLLKYIYEHPKAKKENAAREGLITYYRAKGKKLTKNQAREMITNKTRRIGGVY